MYFVSFCKDSVWIFHHSRSLLLYDCWEEKWACNHTLLTSAHLRSTSYRAHLIGLTLNANYSVIIIPINFWSYDFLFRFLQWIRKYINVFWVQGHPVYLVFTFYHKKSLHIGLSYLYFYSFLAKSNDTLLGVVWKLN